jgi:hypothetical protein
MTDLLDHDIYIYIYLKKWLYSHLIRKRKYFAFITIDMTKQKTRILTIYYFQQVIKFRINNCIYFKPKKIVC